jgi:hypothetical protein
MGRAASALPVAEDAGAIVGTVQVVRDAREPAALAAIAKPSHPPAVRARHD